jgi:hypothetical protein
MQIYSDEKRTATWEPGKVIIYSHTQKKSMPVIPMQSLTIDRRISSTVSAAIKKMGENPAEYRVICRFGTTELVAPANAAEIIFNEANRLENDYRSECDRIANLPENRERRAISDLFAKAERISKSSSEDNVCLPAKIRAEARGLLAAWRAKYPEAAAKEDAEKLMSDASELRSKAIGALLYDCDGMFSGNDQQKRHDDFIKAAEELEARARMIEK